MYDPKIIGRAFLCENKIPQFHDEMDQIQTLVGTVAITWT